MTTRAIIQARMGSTRLPGKALLQAAGKPLLEILIERVLQAPLNEVVVATTTAPEDLAIVELCQRLHVPVVCGSQDDVLNRYYVAAQGADTIVRITGDCPLIDPAVIAEALRVYRENRYDYVSNTIERTFPRGMDVEVFSYQALEKAQSACDDKSWREHVTPYIYRHPELFRLGAFRLDKDESKRRWTVDTPEDFLLIKKVLEAAKPGFTLADLFIIMAQHPEWEAINAHIPQKGV